MATAAADTKKTETPAVVSAGNSSSLLSASIFGAVVLLLGFALVAYAVPNLWDSAVTPVLSRFGVLFEKFFRVVTIAAACVGVIYAATKILPANPPKGTRGGIFIVISVIIAALFIIRAIGLNVNSSNFVGMIIFGVLTGAIVFGAYKFLTSTYARKWMITLEEQGLFHTHSFKKTQGIRTRRWSLIAFVVLGATGVYALLESKMLPVGDWLAHIPFITNSEGTFKGVKLLSDVNYTLPIILTVALVWFSWRIINMPSFGDFLIATDAEMNKVSWATWKKLAQDTFVVLITTALLTAFLLVIDLFWGWLLSDVFKVLPKKDASNTNIPSKIADL